MNGHDERDIHAPDAQGFIPFIHNHCDRWCERCRFVRQCRVGIMEVDDISEEHTEAGTERVEDYEDRLRKVMGMTEDEADDGAEEESASDPDADAGEGTGKQWMAEAMEDYEPDPELERQMEERRKRAEAHPLNDLGRAYMDLVQEWFEPREEALITAGAYSQHRGREVIAPQGPPERMVLREALEEILWFHTLLPVKIHRAVSGMMEDDADDDLDDPYQSDHNGTAKLCLNAVDRSLAAWDIVNELWPEGASDSAAAMACLERCRALLRAEFPNADKFIRPGFDAPGRG